MSYVLPSSINLIEYSCRPWDDVEFHENETDAASREPQFPNENQASCILPRTDHSLFGHFPKLEFGVLVECDKCGKVLLPSAFNAHCNNTEHKDTHAPVQQTGTSLKSHSPNRNSTKASTDTNVDHIKCSLCGGTLVIADIDRIHCSQCSRWFHGACLELSNDEINRLSDQSVT
jgi:hypothetical protein